MRYEVAIGALLPLWKDDTRNNNNYYSWYILFLVKSNYYS